MVYKSVEITPTYQSMLALHQQQHELGSLQAFAYANEHFVPLSTVDSQRCRHQRKRLVFGVWSGEKQTKRGNVVLWQGVERGSDWLVNAGLEPDVCMVIDHSELDIVSIILQITWRFEVCTIWLSVSGVWLLSGQYYTARERDIGVAFRANYGCTTSTLKYNILPASARSNHRQPSWQSDFAQGVWDGRSSAKYWSRGWTHSGIKVLSSDVPLW